MHCTFCSIIICPLMHGWPPMPDSTLSDSETYILFDTSSGVFRSWLSNCLYPLKPRPFIIEITATSTDSRFLLPPSGKQESTRQVPPAQYLLLVTHASVTYTKTFVLPPTARSRLDAPKNFRWWVRDGEMLQHHSCLSVSGWRMGSNSRKSFLEFLWF